MLERAVNTGDPAPSIDSEAIAMEASTAVHEMLGAIGTNGAMADLLRTEMKAGALGLGSGLEYDPGSFSTTEESVRMAVL